MAETHEGKHVAADPNCPICKGWLASIPVHHEPTVPIAQAHSLYILGWYIGRANALNHVLLTSLCAVHSQQVEFLEKAHGMAVEQMRQEVPRG